MDSGLCRPWWRTRDFAETPFENLPRTLRGRRAAGRPTGAEKDDCVADDRLRVPVDDPYVHAVGLATICFARLEWDAVWCCERMEVGYIGTLGRKTAGMIASDLVEGGSAS